MIFRRVGFYIAYGRGLRRSNLSPLLLSGHEFHLSPDLDSSCNYCEVLPDIPRMNRGWSYRGNQRGYR
jgi:hypothetical protein